MMENFDGDSGNVQTIYNHQISSSSVMQNIGKVSNSSGGIKKVPYRRGKWTSEEEAYANRLIHEFKLGMLPLTDGTTLRTFLSKLLNCDPMRISKKFVGQNCIGKQVFRRRPSELDKLTEEQLEKTRRDLSELERLFLERVAQTNRSQRASGGVVKNGRVTYVGEGAPPWMMPPEERDGVLPDGGVACDPGDPNGMGMRPGGGIRQGLKPGAMSTEPYAQPPSSAQVAAMRQSHHPNIGIDAGGRGGAMGMDTGSRKRENDGGSNEDLDAINSYDANMLAPRCSPATTSRRVHRVAWVVSEASPQFMPSPWHGQGLEPVYG